MWPELAAWFLTGIEVGGLVLAGFLLFRSWDVSLAEAAAYSLFLPLMVLSFSFQLAVLSGGEWLAPAMEAGFVLLAGYGIIRFRNLIRTLFRTVIQFARTHPLATTALAVGWLVLVLKALMAVPVSTCRVESLALPGLGNHELLGYYWRRFLIDYRCGLFGFMAYLTIGFATYALARRYAWPPTAITVTLLIVSMPRLIYLVIAGRPEIISAAAAVFSVLALYRTIEHPNARDLSLLLWGILFGISDQTFSVIFPIIMVPLGLLLMYRRHGFQSWWAIVKQQPLKAVLVFVPTLIFSQLPRIAAGFTKKPGMMPLFPFETTPVQPDGIKGALANLGRYLLESAHLTQPFERAGQYLFGVSPVACLQWFHDGPMMSMFGHRGALEPFKIKWAVGTELSWFGPLAFFLILPAILYALFKAPRRLKAVAVTLIGYFYLVTLIFSWVPGNARFFTIFFSVGGYFVAFLLPPWRLSRRQRSLLQILTSLLFFYALLA